MPSKGPLPADATVAFVGRIRTPWNDRLLAPRQGRLDGPVCRIEVFDPWVTALHGLDRFERIEVLYWLHLSRHDLVLQSPANDGQVHGTVSLRSPVRPNPIGTSIAGLVRVEGPVLFVQSLDCLDGTPLLDLRPDRTLFTPIAPTQRATETPRSRSLSAAPDLVAHTDALALRQAFSDVEANTHSLEATG